MEKKTLDPHLQVLWTIARNGCLACNDEMLRARGYGNGAYTDRVAEGNSLSHFGGMEM